MNSEVYHYSNPKRFGHVSAVELVADVYVPFLNRIIANVPVTDDNYVCYCHIFCLYAMSRFCRSIQITGDRLRLLF